MKYRRLFWALRYPLLASLALVVACPLQGLAQEQDIDFEPNAATTLLEAVRFATDRFLSPPDAEAEGYYLQFGCVSGPDTGAMGLHYVNLFITDDALDVARPEIILYEELPNGKRARTGAAYVVLADAWHAEHTSPPTLMEQVFHYFKSPNRFRVPSYYALYVWAWEENPLGAFSDWHPGVSCVPFNG